FQRLAVSPVRGPAGNVEFLALIEPGRTAAEDIGQQVDMVLADAAGLSQSGHHTGEDESQQSSE
ncbi:MAG TPA: hypothetical protein VHS28_07450, partial [Chloroflexota bacterium]|nr:hypothetical protein [Chloroflexota bacterium]